MSLPHMILGILKYRALSGYDLNKAFQASIQHFWNTEQSQIYRALHKMHEQGWVRIEHVAQADVPDKKLYHLTEVGRAELQRWIVSSIPIPTLHEGWLGQLFFGAEVDGQSLRRLLEERITVMQALVENYETNVAAGGLRYAVEFEAQNDLAYWMLTLDYGIQKARFDLQWAEGAIRRLQEMADEQKVVTKE
jgi:PadR family transcriptional regulator, regulatory protein AphA